MSAQLASPYWLEAGCCSPLATGCCWQWRGIFLCSGGFCGVLCSRFSLSTPQRWPISGIRMVHHLPPRFSDSIGSRVPFTMESPLGSSQCRLAFGSASSPGFLRSSRVSPFVLRSGCQSLLSWRPSSSFLSFFFFFFFFFISLKVMFLAEPSDSFGSQGYLRLVVALWNECVSLHPLTRSDLRFSLAMGSSLGPSSDLVAIRSPFFFLGLFHLCPSMVGLSPSSLWICVSWLSSIVCFGCDSRESLPWGGGSLVGVSRTASFFCASLPRSGGAVLFIGFLPRSDLRFPLATGSPSGTIQSLLEFGSLILSLHVFFVSLCG